MVLDREKVQRDQGMVAVEVLVVEVVVGVVLVSGRKKAVVEGAAK